MTRYATRMSTVGKSFIREILKVTGNPEIISFAGGLPNPLSFPIDAIRAASDKVLREDGKAALQYSTTEGYAPLREWIAARYAKKGVRVSANNIMITTGSQQGLDLIGKVFLDRGDGVIIERPGYLGAIQALSMFEPKYLPVTLDDDGVNIPELTRALEHNPKIFYGVPNFQNPSGLSYSEDKRRQVAAVMRQHDTVFIEDDPYGELRFMGKPAPSMGTLLEDNVLLLGSFSKIFSPSMRLGWVYAPDDSMDQLITAKQGADLHTNFFAQRLLYEYLRANDIDAHIETIRVLYKKQRDAMVEAIRRYFPADVKCTEPEGGMFLWATLPDGLSALKLFDAAIARDVAFVPGDPFYVDAQNVSTLRLNYTNSDEAAIEVGIRRLAGAIEEMRG